MTSDHQNNAVLADSVQALIHSWDYFKLDYPQVVEKVPDQYFVPNGLIELIFLQDLEVYEGAYGQALQKLPSAFVWGQTKHGNRVSIKGSGHWFEIKLYPWAFELLFGHPAESLPATGTSFVALSKEFGRLTEQIRLAKNAAEAIANFEHFALQQLEYNRFIQPFLIYSFEQFLNKNGQVKISSLCQKMNVSRQYFSHYFKEKVGLSPKYYSRILRLRHAVDTTYKAPSKSQTEIALDAGYYDQAHYINDFRAILHQSPQSFFQQKQFIYWDL